MAINNIFDTTYKPSAGNNRTSAGGGGSGYQTPSNNKLNVRGAAPRGSFSGVNFGPSTPGAGWGEGARPPVTGKNFLRGIGKAGMHGAMWDAGWQAAGNLLPRTWGFGDGTNAMDQYIARKEAEARRLPGLPLPPIPSEIGAPTEYLQRKVGQDEARKLTEPAIEPVTGFTPEFGGMATTEAPLKNSPNAWVDDDNTVRFGNNSIGSSSEDWTRERAEKMAESLRDPNRSISTYNSAQYLKSLQADTQLAIYDAFKRGDITASRATDLIKEHKAQIRGDEVLKMKQAADPNTPEGLTQLAMPPGGQENLPPAQALAMRKQLGDSAEASAEAEAARVKDAAEKAKMSATNYKLFRGRGAEYIEAANLSPSSLTHYTRKDGSYNYMAIMDKIMSAAGMQSAELNRRFGVKNIGELTPEGFSKFMDGGIAAFAKASSGDTKKSFWRDGVQGDIAYVTPPYNDK
jgi:hypothetical protein